MPNNEVIIIVPGAKDLSAWPMIVQDIVLFFSRLLKFEPTYIDHVKIWKKHLLFKRKTVIWVHWARGIGFISKWFAKRKLKRLLNHYARHNVKLVGISLGGDIILETIKANKFDNIKKIVLVGSINEIKGISFEHPKIINIYSKQDNFAKIAIGLYSPINGGEKLLGKNILNIDLPNMPHDQLCRNAKVNQGRYKGRHVTDIIRIFLKG